MKTSGYSIKDLEVLSGIKAHTIRIWEKRYDLLEPERTDTNIRFYNDNDLKRMLNISMLVKNGYKISKVSRWSDEKLKDAILDITTVKKNESNYIDQLILYTINFDNDGFSKMADQIIQDIGIEEAVSNVFFDFFVKIGTYWQVGTIFPAQEHYVSCIFRQKLIAATEHLKVDAGKNMTILFFLAEHEMHEMSLLFYAYFAKKKGYRLIYLGQFVPFDDLKLIRDKIQTDYLFTAFINAVSKDDLQQYLTDLKNLFDKQKIFITGRQLEIHQPELPRNTKIIRDYRDFQKYLG